MFKVDSPKIYIFRDHCERQQLSTPSPAHCMACSTSLRAARDSWAQGLRGLRWSLLLGSWESCGLLKYCHSNFHVIKSDQRDILFRLMRIGKTTQFWLLSTQLRNPYQRLPSPQSQYAARDPSPRLQADLIHVLDTDHFASTVVCRFTKMCWITSSIGTSGPKD